MPYYKKKYTARGTRSATTSNTWTGRYSRPTYSGSSRYPYRSPYQPMRRRVNSGRLYQSSSTGFTTLLEQSELCNRMDTINSSLQTVLMGATKSTMPISQQCSQIRKELIPTQLNAPLSSTTTQPPSLLTVQHSTELARRRLAQLESLLALEANALKSEQESQLDKSSDSTKSNSEMRSPTPPRHTTTSQAPRFMQISQS